MEQNISNNNQNNLSWAERISEYDVIPNEEMTAEKSAWERLQGRYPQKRIFKNRYFYWVAASLIVMLMVPVILKYSNHDNTQLKKVVVDKPKANIKKGNQLFSLDTTQIVKEKNLVNKVNEQKKDKGVLNVAKAKLQTSLKRSTVILHRIDTAVLVAKKTDQTNSERAIPNVAAKTFPDSSNQNKKMTIVHINNLKLGETPIEYDNRKVRRFLRRYDVDAPPKTATGYNKIGFTIKDIN